MKLKPIILSCLLTLLSGGIAHAQIPGKAKLDLFFDRLAEKNKAMGSLVIAKEGSIIYSRSIGFSQISGNEKKSINAESRFRIGSITKTFTAVMIFQLIDDKKLTLNDPLGKFFPRIPNAEKITVGQILAHRSGIHDLSGDRDFRDWSRNPATKEEIFARLAKSEPDFEPGSKYAYSNYGYFVLAGIIEKITGKAYGEVLKKVTTKSGLKDTYIAAGNIDVNNKESLSYKYGRDWEPQPETHISVLFGAGSITSTPADMAKFMQALFDGKLVSGESLAQMKEKEMGLEKFIYNGKTLYGHTGGVDGFGSWLVYLPEEKLAVSYAANAKVYPVSDIIDAVFYIYWDQHFTIPTFESIVISQDLLDKYAGVYSISGAPARFTVTRDGAALFVQMNGQSAIPLEAVSPTKFKIEAAGIVMEFDAAKKQMTMIRNGRERVFTKE
jgi:D-alanyl-D-alanine carboxypeptidase